MKRPAGCFISRGCWTRSGCLRRASCGKIATRIYELSEQDCLKAFPAVKLGIELILDEELERHARQKKIEAASKALDSTVKEIKQSKTT